MRKRGLFVVAFLAALYMAVGVFAQVPTGKISGHVTDGKAPLPGVTITATAPTLQGAKTAVTSINGDYIIPLLPPGDYKLKFELQGFVTLEQTVKVSAAQTQTLNAVMPQSTVAEAVTVTGSYETISSTTTAAATYEKGLIEKLPVGRDVNTYIALAPATTTNGPRGATTIGGAFSYENLYMINGVSVNENIRGTNIPLYIEDAVQEATTTTSGVSAEYGRFAGGVVNALTKSGGNEFHLSLRDTMTNDKWSSKTPKTTTQTDKINNTYEATLGGFLVKDKLWFFVAGRHSRVEQTLSNLLGDPFPGGTRDKRFEAKLTFAASTDHRFVGSYTNFDNQSLGRTFFAALDLNTTIVPDIRHDLKSFNYTGILSPNFFVEAQYSNRRETFYNYGCTNYDLIQGTPVYDFDTGAQYNCSFFGANRGGAEKRDNEEILLKGSWFFSSAGAGSHDIVFGVDQFKDMRLANNYQSTTDFVLYSNNVNVGPGPQHQLYPVFTRKQGIVIEWDPIVNPSKGNDLKTLSGFINDKWRLNNHLTFNIGVRYDKNDAKNADGGTTAKDSVFSPRLGVAYDVNADGSWTVTGSFGKYVGQIQQNFADANAAGGQPGQYWWNYLGPDINANCDPAKPTPATCIGVRDAMKQVFDWFRTYGWTDKKSGPAFSGASVSYLQYFIPSGLKSPSADEFAFGVTKRFGSTGLVRFDYLNRKYTDFYSYRIDQGTGQVQDAYGNSYDAIYVLNSNKDLSKKYWAYILQWQARPSSDLYVGGNYTYSRAYGNFSGENSGSGPINTDLVSYPEFKQVKWYAPVGDLSIDQRHRARLFAVYDVFKQGHNRLSVSAMESFMSGSPYGAVGSIDSVSYVDAKVASKYATPPPTVTYWYTARDRYHWDNATSTDIGINYSFVVNAFGTDLEFYIEPKMTNVFNEKAVVSGSTSIQDPTSSSLASFNPYTQTPVEGVNWAKRSSFGKPRNANDYQTPRTYYFSFGIRF